MSTQTRTRKVMTSRLRRDFPVDKAKQEQFCLQAEGRRNAAIEIAS
jgi:hypothetical protein